jgi:hypothetical protein
MLKRRLREATVKALSIEEVLAEEADAIHGTDWRREKGLTGRLPNQDEHHERAWLNADRKYIEAAKNSRSDTERSDIGFASGTETVTEKVAPRKELYRALNKLNRAALCCSGGGIRSATFCLGVIQALAAYDVTSPAPPPPNAPTPATGPSTAHNSPTSNSEPTEAKSSESPAPRKKIKPESSLLGRIHYLSTVSGGGYIGSWLSSWRAHDDFPNVVRNLTDRPDGADVEPPEISWLRAYSNYLTPRIGIASADSWAAVAICLRNLVLNWLIIIPIVCLVLLALKLIAIVGVWIAHGVKYEWLPISFLVIGVLLLIEAQAFMTDNRPTRHKQVGKMDETTFLKRGLLLAVLSAIALTIFFSSRYFSSVPREMAGLTLVKSMGLDLKTGILALTTAGGFLIYSAGWLWGWPPIRRGRDFIWWAFSGLIYGALVGLGAYLFILLNPYPTPTTISGRHLCLLLPIIFGVPWVLTAQMAAEIVFIGLTTYENNADSDREWLGRAAGWLAASAIAWALTAFLVFAGDYAIQAGIIGIKQLLATGAISGLATAFLGSSSKTPAKATSDHQKDPTAIAFNVGLAIAGPLFAAILIIALSAALDKALLGGSLVEQLLAPTLSKWAIAAWLVVGSLIAAVVAWLASYYVNINRYSLHALYRNRLVRAYLGASRQERDPDSFTGFDPRDNFCVFDLWPRGDDPKLPRLFHVINIALNVVSTKRLAWQERKAESFTVSPRHCGSAYLGFRPSDQYGGDSGLSLGTAMAISGAAVSPNMGYNSSPSISLLLTLFNVRLGWWLGNPGPAGEDYYQTEGPKWAAGPLIEEAFGQTTDTSPYVYLSDGGHFEDLGLYEMVRRRCRFIVVIDAGCDPDFTFEDLGNAVRKIYIDLGIRIEFGALQTILNRPSNKAMWRAAVVAPGDEPRKKIPYYAIATIDYVNADGAEVGCDNGYLLYIKPAYHGTEGAGIRSYATAHPEFPHESTADQWFTESQFESYRSLGLDIANNILGQREVWQKLHQFLNPAHHPTSSKSKDSGEPWSRTPLPVTK